jgi:hypothetical protein
MEVSIPAGVIPAARVQAPLRRRPRIFQSGERRTRSPARERRSAFETAPAPWRVHSPGAVLRPGVNRPEMAEDGAHDAQRLATPIRFPSAAGTLAGSSSMAEGAVFETDGVTRASLSGRARRPGRFTFHWVVGRDKRAALVRANLAGRESPATLRTLPGIRTRTSSS